MFLDRLDPRWATLGLADHRNESGLRQHHFGEFIHACRRRWAGGADHFVAHRIDRADVIDHAILKIDRQFFALGEHVLNAFVRGVAAGEHLAGKQQGLARLPCRDFIFGQRIHINARALVVVRLPMHVGPQIQRRRL